MTDPAVSLTAEVLLLAIDPGGEGLLTRNRGRFRRALAATSASGHGSPWAASRARRSALSELERTGLIQPRGLLGPLRLADRTSAGERFRRVRRCLEDRGAAEPRDWELLVLLAWSGVLVRRLNRDERRIALRRLRELFRTAEEGDLWKPPGGDAQAMPAWVPRLGGIVAMAADIDLFEAPGMTDFGSDHSGFKAPYG